MRETNIDFLIVGAGLFGSTCARILSDSRYNCLVIEKRNHIAGLCYTEPHESGYYDIHKYGPHVFHTSNNSVAKFVSTYSKFNSYRHEILAYDGNDIYNLPFNMHTFNKLFGVVKPEEAENVINEETKEAKLLFGDTDNLEAVAQTLIGKTIFNKFIKEYTEKQWGCKCYELPGDIIKRLPIRYSYNNNYFNDVFYGIPKEGYTNLLKNILDGKSYDGKIHNKITYLCDIDFLNDKEKWISLPKHGVIYCGSIDELLDYELGELEWRSLEFKEGSYEYNGMNGQGCSSINFITKDYKQTRRIEHMYFTEERWKNKTSFESVYTDEFPKDYVRGMERYYPINNDKNNSLYNDYKNLLNLRYPNVMMGGRLGLYKYINMDETIAYAINASLEILKLLDIKCETSMIN